MGFLFRRPPTARSLAEVHGPARCVRAVELLQNIQRNPSAIPATWETIELLLIQAVPDCPPASKVALIRALEDCSAACRQRDIARRIMLVRDSLV